MGSPSHGRPGNAAGSPCYRERGLPYSAVDGIQGTLGPESQHDRLRVIQDPGNRNADRLDAVQALARLGKHQLQVLARDIVRRARNESCSVQPLLWGHVEITERCQPRLRLPGRGANGRIVPEQHMPVDGARTGIWFRSITPAVSCLVRYRHFRFSPLGTPYLIERRH